MARVNKKQAPRGKRIRTVSLSDPERLERFCDVYRSSFNATEAAKAIGYAPSIASQSGAILLQQAQVQEILARQAMTALAETRISPNWVLTMVAEIAAFDPKDLYGDHVDARGRYHFYMKEIKVMPSYVSRCLKKMKVIRTNLVKGDGHTDELYEVQWYDRLQALALLMQHLGLLKVQVELDHQVRAEALEKMTDEEFNAEVQRIAEKIRRDTVARAALRLPAAEIVPTPKAKAQAKARR